MVNSKYFKESEFQACSPACSLQDMDQTLMNRLDRARELAGIPFVLTSAYRSTEWDRGKGRSGTGAHTIGVAVDIRCNTSRNRFLIVQALLHVGFRRIGIADNFIHVDGSAEHDDMVIWTY